MHYTTEIAFALSLIGFMVFTAASLYSTDLANHACTLRTEERRVSEAIAFSIVAAVFFLLSLVLSHVLYT